MDRPAPDPLSARLAAADAHDGPRLHGHVLGLRTLQESLEREDSYELSEQLDVALELAELLASPGGVSRERLLELVSRTVARVERVLDAREAPDDVAEDDLYADWGDGSLSPGPLPDPPAIAPAGPGGSLRLEGERDYGAPARERLRDVLRVNDDKLFGEILVQLGMLTQEAVDRGLLAQRGTGRRIGEVLVETGALTWDQVSRAAEVQRKLKRACRP